MGQLDGLKTALDTKKTLFVKDKHGNMVAVKTLKDLYKPEW